MSALLRHALRSLARTPVFAATATITLTLGIGSVAAMFAITYGVLLKPLPYGHPDRLVSAGLEVPSPERRHVPLPGGAYFTYKRFARLADDIAFYRTGNGNMWAGGDDSPERVTATWVTPSTIPLLEVSPLLGRAFFTADEEGANGRNAAIISEPVWRSRFHASPDVIGRTLYVNSVPRVVVGVMPESFHFPQPDTRLWLPAKLDRAGNTIGDFTWSGVVRLKDGASIRAAQADLAAALSRMAELFPRLESGTSTRAWLDQTQPRPTVVPLRDEVTNGIARTLWLLAAAAALVLLVACANVANLMLIRADARQLELAVREALGAGRLRIATSFLGESLTIATVAGAAAFGVASAAVHALVTFGPAEVPRLTELTTDWTTAAFVVVVSVACAVVCAAVPAFRLMRNTMSVNLRDGGRGETAGRTRQRLRATIAALQIAVALVVVAGSALLLRTFERLRHEPPGFDAHGVITLWTQLPFARYGGDSSAVTFYARLAAAVRSLPTVRAAGLTSRLPLADGETRQQGFRLEDGRGVTLPVSVIDDGYLETLHIPLIAGRGFEATGVQRDGEIVVSRRAAETIWNDATGREAVGKRLTLAPSGPTYTVIGVAGDVRDRDLATAPSAVVYVPQAVPIDRVAEPQARRTLGLVVRTAGPSAPVVSAVRGIVRDLDPAVPIFGVATMSDVVRASTARLSLVLTLMSIAAAITLVLGAIGLYGVVAYMVALRTREFGVRIALGAEPRQVARSVAGRGMRLIVGGVVGGLAAFAVVAPFLRAFLYGVGPSDPVTLLGATAVLVATGVLANWLPARRAARIDPAEALRAE